MRVFSGEAAEGCTDELHAALNAVAPPTTGSDELLAVVECLKGVAVETAKAKGADKNELLTAAGADCPAELATCEAESGCMAEFHSAVTQREPPTDGAPSMLAVISCLRKAALARRKQGPPPGGRGKAGGSGDAAGKMKFRPADKMSEDEKAAAHKEMVDRVAGEVACGLCETLIDDIWSRSATSPWVKEVEAAVRKQKQEKESDAKADSALHISGVSVSAACAARPLPTFAQSYSVHPCTAAAVKDGRCAARQQYHLRNSCSDGSAGDEQPSEDEFGEVLASMYSQSSKQQVRPSSPNIHQISTMKLLLGLCVS